MIHHPHHTHAHVSRQCSHMKLWAYALFNLLKGISMTTYGATMFTFEATGSTSSIGSSLVVATGCWSTTGLEIGAEAIGT